MAEIWGEIFGSNIYLCKNWLIEFCNSVQGYQLWSSYYNVRLYLWFLAMASRLQLISHNLLWSVQHTKQNQLCNAFVWITLTMHIAHWTFLCISLNFSSISLHFSAFLCISLHFFRQHYSLIIYYHSLSSLPLLFTIIHYYPCYSL